MSSSLQPLWRLKIVKRNLSYRRQTEQHGDADPPGCRSGEQMKAKAVGED